MPTRLQIARKDILEHFEQLGRSKVYRYRDISQILQAERYGWRLAEKTTTLDLIDLLGRGKGGKLRTLTLKPKKGSSLKPITRYAWDEASLLAVAQTARPNAYISHGSAVFHHGLNELLPRTIYVNQEQSPKPRPSAAPTQERVDAAFRRRQRTSNFILTLDDHDVVVLSGKATGRLEVETVRVPEGQHVDVTSVERTLVDIAVRPVYAGGVEQVLAAYEGARERMSVNVLLRTLQKLDYAYPYHQAIGFYMERAGFPDRRLERLRALPRTLNFHLTYGIKNSTFSERWRLFVPQGL